MLLVAAFALAADPLPVGSLVAVRKGVKLVTPGGEAEPAVSGAGFAAEVFADDGDRVRVRLSERGCVPVLTASREIDTVFTVAEADLLPLVAADVAGALPTGHGWALAAGAPVVELGEAQLRVDLGTQVIVALPRAAVPVATAVLAIGSTPGSWGRQLYGTGGLAGHFGDQEVRPSRLPLSVEAAGERVAWAGRCGRIELSPAAPAAEAPGFGGLLGGVGGGRVSALLPVGTALSWPDGTPAGTLKRPSETSRYTDVRPGRRCTAWTLAEYGAFTRPQVTLCVAEARITEAEAGGSRPTSPPALPTSPGARVEVRVQAPEVSGTLDATAVAAMVTRAQPGLRYCYARERVTAPPVAGPVIAWFTIDATGHTGGVRVSGSPESEAVRTCMVARLQRMTGPKGGAGVVKLPMELVPAPAP